MGVVTSEGVYLRLSGNTFVRAGVVARLGLMGRIPRPLEVVHSGKTTAMRVGFCLRNVSMSTTVALSEGLALGWQKARQTMVKSDTGSTRRLEGYVAAKTGLKMAARYRASIGEAHEEAMMEPAWGILVLFFAKALEASAGGSI